MFVSKEEIIHIANLANLNLSEEEILKYSKEITDILEFTQIVNDINTDEIKETIGINGEYNVFRKDEIKEPIPKNELLKNAPSECDGMFRIPKVIK